MRVVASLNLSSDLISTFNYCLKIQPGSVYCSSNGSVGGKDFFKKWYPKTDTFWFCVGTTDGCHQKVAGPKLHTQPV